MKTYAESYSCEPFNWVEFLHRTDISEEDWCEARHKACDWTTCACGAQCVIIPRNQDGEPIDSILRHLGINFMDEVENAHCFRTDSQEHQKNALEILEKIEARSQTIIDVLGDFPYPKVIEINDLFSIKEALKNGVVIIPANPAYDRNPSQHADYPMQKRIVWIFKGTAPVVDTFEDGFGTFESPETFLKFFGDESATVTTRFYRPSRRFL